MDIDIDDIRKIISFLQYNGLLVGTDESSYVSKQSMLWGKFTIMSSVFIKKLEFLKILHKKKTLITLSIIMIMLNIGLFYINRESLSFQLHKLMSLRSIVGFILINAALILCHEIGHATALMKYKLYPKRIGGGVYITKPVMFADATESWKLSRNERQYVNMGGIYFQGILSTAMFLIFAAFKLTIELNLILYSNFLMLANLNIFIKSDGYWVFSDLLGISNLHEVIIQRLPFVRRHVKSVYRIGVGNTIIIYTYLCIFIAVVVLIGIVVVMNAYVSFIVVARFYKSGINNYHDIMEIIFSILTFVLFLLFVRVIIKYIKRIISIRSMNKRTK